MNEKEAQNMNKNDINQTTSQENKNKSKNREEDITDHKKTKANTHLVESNTWIKNKHWKTNRGPHQQKNPTKGPQPSTMVI